MLEENARAPRATQLLLGKEERGMLSQKSGFYAAKHVALCRNSYCCLCHRREDGNVAAAG